jgi:hypothetical protein
MNTDLGGKANKDQITDEKYRKLKKKFAGLALEHRKLLG